MGDEFYMQLAIDEAWKYQILTYPNPPVGCTILDENGKILSIGAHKKAGHAHAELSAVTTAFSRAFPDINLPQTACELYDFILKNHNFIFKNATAYVTLEPCSHQGKTPPCANLLANLGFKRVVIGIKDNNELAKDGASILKERNIKVEFGVCKQKCQELIEPFLAYSKGNFSFFKLATTLNGVIDGGAISSLSSRTHMHSLREVINLLVIGGNSVRCDLPTLDTRLINGSKNPDIFIYTNQKDSSFSRLIPLFGVKNRSVEISNDLNSVFKRNLVMFEGGANLLSSLDWRVEWVLVYCANEFKNRLNFNCDMKFKPLKVLNMGEDSIIWLKRVGSQRF